VNKLATLAPEGKVVGLDYSAASVAVSRDTNADDVAAGRVHIEQGSVAALPFPGCTFDVVAAVETHYYWPDLPANLREIRRVLKPGGMFTLIAETYRGGPFRLVYGIVMPLLRAAFLSDEEHRDLLTQAQLYLTLRQTSNSQELAKIDPDTGLQEDTGPSRNRFVSVSLQRNFPHGAFYVSYSQADARDLDTGAPVPEAPRMIWDAVASENHLPFGLQLRGEFEFVKAKPLGKGFDGVSVYEIRGALLRPFFDNRMSLGANFLVASGYTGQTTETIPSQPGLCSVECVVGVPLKSYVSLSWTYYFKK
jgi:SAM-dependent methyltransferase